jgi:tetratricopeptide (TPR) repeat protein
VDLAGAEPEVRAVVTEARDRVVTDPTSASAWGRLGKVLRAHGYEYDADVCFREAATRAPEDPRWPYYRGLHALLRDPDRAVGFLHRAAELRPPDRAGPAVRLRLAEALLERGQLDEAEAIFRGELADAPADPRASYDLAVVSLARGDPVATREHLAAAAGSPFTRKKAAAAQATAARQRGDAAAAARHEQVARALPEDLPWVDPYVTDAQDLQVGLQKRFLQAEALKAQGRLPEAARQFAAIAESRPGPRTYVAAGIALAEVGDYPAAERYLRDCLQLDPDHIQGNYFLAITLFFQAEKDWEQDGGREQARVRFRESTRHARKCLERKPDHGLAHLFLGRSLLRLGEASEAVGPLGLAVACRPELAEPHLFLAEALLETGNPAEAQKSLTIGEQLAGRGDEHVRRLRSRLGVPNESR